MTGAAPGVPRRVSSGIGRPRSWSVLAVVALLLVGAGAPGLAADDEPAPGGDDRQRSHSQVDTIAATLIEAREEPLRPRPEVSTASVEFAAIQDYHDTCGDAEVGDLLGLNNIDSGAMVGWQWSTCAGRGFHGTDDELVLMTFYDSALPRDTNADFAIAQWPADGFVQIFYAGRQPQVEDWLLLGSGFAPVETRGDRVVQGRFSFDAGDLRFPTEYEFAVSTNSAQGLEDLLPKSGHPTPTFPTRCTTIVPFRAEVVLDDGVTYADVAGPLAATGASVRAGAASAHGILVLDDVDAHVLARVAALDGVRSVERSRRVESARLEADWHLRQLDPGAGTAGLPAKATHIAVIDDGVDVLHPTMQGSVGPGYDTIAEQVVPAGRSTNMGYHGTAVASMIVGDGSHGVHGSNPKAMIRPISVASHDGCISTDRVVAAIVAAAEMPEVSVINLSLAGPTSFAEQSAVDLAEQRGKLVVAASGNDQQAFPDQANYPAGLSNVIGVGATTASGGLAAFSQTAGADILAPGADIEVASPTGGVWVESGTSFAAPLVAGVLATWAVDNPGAATADARAALLDAGVPVSGSAAPLLDAAALLTPQEAPEAVPPGDDDAATDPDAGPQDGAEGEEGAEGDAAPAPEDGAEGDAVPAPEEDAQAQPSFPDIAGSVHESSILAVAQAGIAGGYADGRFGPGDAVTRDQMATFLSRALGLEASGPQPFSDVAEGSTHDVAVRALVEAGITGGCSEDAYCPSDEVTRDQMASFLSRALGLEASGPQPFSDVAEGSTHDVAVRALVEAGVTSGCGDDRYCPRGPVTRGQMATFLVRALDL